MNFVRISFVTFDTKAVLRRSSHINKPLLLDESKAPRDHVTLRFCVWRFHSSAPRDHVTLRFCVWRFHSSAPRDHVTLRFCVWRFHSSAESNCCNRRSPALTLNCNLTGMWLHMFLTGLSQAMGGGGGSVIKKGGDRHSVVEASCYSV